jgi:hypothetical protein
MMMSLFKFYIRLNVIMYLQQLSCIDLKLTLSLGSFLIYQAMPCKLHARHFQRSLLCNSVSII